MPLTLMFLNKLSVLYRIYRKDRRIFLPQIPILLGVRRSFQVETATSHQPLHPGQCVPLSRVLLSRQRLTQQSLKRVGHEGKLCLKVEQRLVRSHCLSPLGGDRCHRVHHRPTYNLLYRYVEYTL